MPGPEAVASEQNVDEAELQGYLMQNVAESQPEPDAEQAEPQSSERRDLDAKFFELAHASSAALMSGAAPPG